MKTGVLTSVLSFALAGTLHAIPRTSANYSIASDGVDDGGTRTASAAYANDGSTGGFAGGASTGAAGVTAKSGFAGQLYDIIGLGVTAPTPTASAGETLHLEARQALDDGTFLPVPAALTFQWFVNGAAIGGATSATLSVPNAQHFNAGAYTFSGSANGVTLNSSSFAVTVNLPPANDARLLNLSTRAQALTGDDVIIPGFVVAGTGNKRLLIRAVGPTLGKPPFNLGGVLPDPRMRLLKRNTTTQAFEEIAANDNWATNSNAAAITQTAADLFAFAFNDSLESALLMDLAPGEYTVIASGVNNATGIAIVELYDADSGTPGARLINISNRGFAGVGAQVMIPGFVISSEGPKTLLVRVVGPTLGSFGVGGTMADPKLEVFPGGASTPILTNDNWGDNTDAVYTAQVASQVFAFGLTAGSKDAAFVVTLPPGSYTVVGSSATAGGTGVVLVEVYVVP